ncbi:NADPH-dependent 1-acyldihydroxyacetone phosphate [Cyphellophora attinorum]|uniref:NADPH-dependent 1-acyldihydroxyacetone phosphate n=1 Tax=Cyphellophora attinorum TaxID=1664694 RepID=A0A0N1H2B2_9EURO|nr:NADPH-dependent 1-acyldihydroxyacetone phosphate [Phialophora attinorum]KPI34376.1 NADPH-dependent 1-acyldihydroxyacetone phosphate [Phialophora attinorum]
MSLSWAQVARGQQRSQTQPALPLPPTRPVTPARETPSPAWNADSDTLFENSTGTSVDDDWDSHDGWNGNAEPPAPPRTSGTGFSAWDWTDENGSKVPAWLKEKAVVVGIDLETNCWALDKKNGREFGRLKSLLRKGESLTRRQQDRYYELDALNRQGRVSEIGMAFLNSKHLSWSKRGDRFCNAWKHIGGVNLIIREHEHVGPHMGWCRHNDPDHDFTFLYGKPEKISKAAARNVMVSKIKHALGDSPVSASKAPYRNETPIVFVFFAKGNDLRWLAPLGIDLLAEFPNSTIVDCQWGPIGNVISRNRHKPQCNAGDYIEGLGIDHTGSHNGGNDAVHELRAFLAECALDEEQHASVLDGYSLPRLEEPAVEDLVEGVATMGLGHEQKPMNNNHKRRLNKKKNDAARKDPSPGSGISINSLTTIPFTPHLPPHLNTHHVQTLSPHHRLLRWRPRRSLALAFHAAGLKVYATARNPAKLTQMTAAGIETLTLDVLSDSSIKACADKVSKLDLLVNNAGAGYTAAFSDINIKAAKETFDLNVWSSIAVTQAFLPQLIASKGVVVFNTSGSSVAPQPFTSSYNASKAAIAMYAACLRLEVEDAFGVRVVDLKTGAVKSNFGTSEVLQKTHVPEKSIFAPAKVEVEKSMTLEGLAKDAIEAKDWAEAVVRDLTRKNPPATVWRGSHAGLAKIAQFFPLWLTNAIVKRMMGMGEVAAALRGR